MKRILILIFVLTMCFSSFAGDLRLGLKVGIPTGVGLNLEYALPMTFGTIAVDGDFSQLKTDDITTWGVDKKDLHGLKDVGFEYNYIGAGAKVYVPLIGIYAGAAVGQGDVKATSNYSYMGETVNIKCEKTATFLTAKAGMRLTILFLTAGVEAGVTKNDIKELSLTGKTTKGIEVPPQKITNIPEITPMAAIYAGVTF